MNAKQSKKIRRMYRRDYERSAKKVGRLIGNALKPKPRFVPMWLWMAGVKIFIKVK